MNKKLVKIFSMLLIVLMLCSVSLNVFATGSTTGSTKGSTTGSTTDITPSSIDGSGSVDTGSISSIGNNIVKILQTVGIVLSVVILIVIGIKYMMGSPEEKSEYKKSMMPYIIGAALIFAASALAQVVFNFFTGWTAG